MRFHRTIIEGCWLIKPEPLRDHRGSFMRTFCRDEFRQHGIDLDIVQSSISTNLKRGTLRGMHYQAAPFEECKFVQCVRGSMFDVVLDVRLESPTFGRWVSHELKDSSHDIVIVPPGCAHGFQTLEDDTEILYQMSVPYSPEHSRGVRWNDHAFDIRWPLPNPIMSERDQAWPLFTSPRSGRAAPDPCAAAVSG